MWTDEDMDEQAAEVVNLRNYAGEKKAERAAAKGLAGLFEWIVTDEVT